MMTGCPWKRHLCHTPENTIIDKEHRMMLHLLVILGRLPFEKFYVQLIPVKTKMTGKSLYYL